MSKEMIELADELAECGAYPMAGLPGALKFIAGFALTEAKRDMIVAALRASAVAEPVAWLSIAQNHYGLWRERPEFGEGDGFTVRPLYAHPAPAAPVPASVREALELARSALHEQGVADRVPITLGRIERALASLPAPEAAPTPDLTDPNVVHVNMLRGTIAKPTWEQIKHLYPEQAAAPTREEYAAVLAQELWCGATFADAAPSEREAFLRAVDAILALKSAPAK